MSTWRYNNCMWCLYFDMHHYNLCLNSAFNGTKLICLRLYKQCVSIRSMSTPNLAPGWVYKTFELANVDFWIIVFVWSGTQSKWVVWNYQYVRYNVMFRFKKYHCFRVMMFFLFLQLCWSKDWNAIWDCFASTTCDAKRGLWNERPCPSRHSLSKINIDL